MNVLKTSWEHSRYLLLGEISSNGDKSKTKSFRRRDLYCQPRTASHEKQSHSRKII
jgi:hypothetical protein